jgi:hypothetical protein
MIQNKLLLCAMKKPTYTFEQFLSYFPEADLPVLLNEEAIQTFSRQNKPLPGPLIEQFSAALQEGPTDEFTEFVACFRLKNTGPMYALVYWKAHLLSHEYHLATFTREGRLIDRRGLAGTYSDGESLIRSVATIEEDWEIIVVSGQSHNGRFQASDSRTIQLEILPDGNIVDVQ